MDYFVEVLIKLLPYIKITLLLSFASMLLGLIFGGMLAAMKLGKSKILIKTANLFTTFVRCTPVIILLFLSYYGLPLLFELIGIDISRGSKIMFSIVALTMYSSATLSEIIRPAFFAVNKGQLEAALMAGLTFFQAMRIVVLPQVFYIALPNFGNMLIALTQESALAYLIGVVDIMGQAKVINSMNYGVHILEIYLAVSFIYWILSLAIGRTVDVLTLRMSRILGKN